jgi:hypothetical protein
VRNANQQAKLYRRKDKKIDRQKKLHAPIVPDLNHARLDRMMRCLDGEFNSVLVAGGEGGLGIKYTHLDHFLPE